MYAYLKWLKVTRYAMIWPAKQGKARKADCAYVQLKLAEGQMWQADVLIVHIKGNAETTRQLTTPTKISVYICMWYNFIKYIYTLYGTLLCCSYYYYTLWVRGSDGVIGRSEEREWLLLYYWLQDASKRIYTYHHAHTYTYTHTHINIVNFGAQLTVNSLTHLLVFVVVVLEILEKYLKLSVRVCSSSRTSKQICYKFLISQSIKCV